MPAKTILTLLFLISLGVVAMLYLHAVSGPVTGDTAAAKDEILVATMPLARGTLLRAQDVVWRPMPGAAEPDQIPRPAVAARNAKPELDELARAEVYGAALRAGIAAGGPIRRGAIVKPGDRVDVILTQTFRNDAPLTRRSVSETVVESLRVLAVDASDLKPAGAGNGLGRTVTLEMTPEQAEKISVATELGKLSLALRSISSTDGVVATSTPRPGGAPGIKPTWAGDVSPALVGAMPPEKVVAAERPPVEVIHGAKKSEAVKPQ